MGVKESIFSLKEDAIYMGLIHYFNLNSNTGLKPLTKIMAKPLRPRIGPSLVNFANKFLFVSGGRIKHGEEESKSVDFYNIQKNTWSPAPAMNVARSSHSSCVLGEQIFAFCGANRVKKIHLLALH